LVLELIVNVLLFLFSIFCFWYVGATMPQSPDNELGAEQWPQAILVLLLIAIGYNIIRFFRTHKKEELGSAFADFFPGILRFLKSKLLIGMVILVVMALLYEPLGFLGTSFFFLAGYSLLLGERRLHVVLVSSFVIMLLLYLGFSVFLGVLLPRGSVPLLRNAALFLESIFQKFK
jgi:uncharacterized protein involved in response to NO